jgi:hypothetical protein
MWEVLQEMSRGFKTICSETLVFQALYCLIRQYVYLLLIGMVLVHNSRGDELISRNEQMSNNIRNSGQICKRECEFEVTIKTQG